MTKAVKSQIPAILMVMEILMVVQTFAIKFVTPERKIYASQDVTAKVVEGLTHVPQKIPQLG